MRITRIQLLNYRNYARADIAPCPGVTVLFGDNAQGKTNLLEAISLCCTGRSHRTPRDKELIKWGEGSARVTVEASRPDGTHEVSMLLSETERKTVKVNGRQIAKSGELMGHLMGVLFAPEDLRMVKDGPAERRRFIDMELSQVRPSYYYALQRYNRALAQRNHLLREMAIKPALRETLPEWDAQLAANGAQIAAHRSAFIARLSAAASENHAQISGGREMLSVVYRPNVEGAGEDEILRALARALPQDMKRGTTSAGPHRDDLALMLADMDVRAFGSQGQQRTAALSLKLSELMVMKEETGEWPVLMLDDVMSELDPNRRRQLIKRLGDIQTLVTCTDLTDLAGAEIGAAFSVSGGQAHEADLSDASWRVES